jgi:nucleotide-binding universal stress UspA family protein
MTTFHKILVPTDFSEGSQRATSVAADLSRRFGASLTLVYVFERNTYPLPDVYVMFSDEQLDELFAEFNQRLSSASRQALDAGAVNVTSRLLQGSAPGEITHFAEDTGIDLIVMGTRGRTGFQHLLLGSVAERVVRTAHCPVLTVNEAKHVRSRGSAMHVGLEPAAPSRPHS